MGNVSISVEAISKLYRLGVVSTGTISHDLNRFWHRMRGKPDPYAIVGEANERDVQGNSQYAWALRDINFEVRQGEVLGIVGRNGAGKSTLLKILSRVTRPTSGQVKIRGKVASLLEVGTGFHPELTGRENVFLNATILGMRKREVVQKLDAIVDFAGCARYLDTPVKRYSSGMYVRLAFAVAAHLDPEILIVDEVLAVGDADFQTKCISKMKELASSNGRTVLLVSHNMQSVLSLATKAILLKNGTVEAIGEPSEIVPIYQKQQRREDDDCSLRLDRIGSGEVRLHRLELQTVGGRTPVNLLVAGEKCNVTYQVHSNFEETTECNVGLGLYSFLGHRVMFCDSKHKDKRVQLTPGMNTITLTFDLPFFTPGDYYVSCYVGHAGRVVDGLAHAAYFSVQLPDVCASLPIVDCRGEVLILDAEFTSASL